MLWEVTVKDMIKPDVTSNQYVKSAHADLAPEKVQLSGAVKADRGHRSF